MTTRIGEPKQFEMRIEGLPVADSKRNLSFVVRKNDIGKGRAKDPVACAVAKACLRLQGVSAVKVHISRTYVKINGRWRRFTTPKEIRKEIISFDRRGSFEPGSYDLLPAFIKIKRPRRNLRDRKSSPRSHKTHVIRGIRTKMSGGNILERIKR